MGNGYWEAKTVNHVLESLDRCHNGKYFGLGQERGDGKTDLLEGGLLGTSVSSSFSLPFLFHFPGLFSFLPLQHTLGMGPGVKWIIKYAGWPAFPWIVRFCPSPLAFRLSHQLGGNLSLFPIPAQMGMTHRQSLWVEKAPSYKAAAQGGRQTQLPI